MLRDDVNELLSTALDSPEFRRALVQVSQEKATRPVRPCRCVVVEIPETAEAEDFAAIAPGTVAAFVAREGEPLLRTLARAVRAADSEAFDLATDQVKQMGAEVARRIAGAGSYAESQFQSFPSFAEISYASKTLVGHVHVDDVLRVHAHAFPYNGGYLNRNRFSMIEYYRADFSTPLTCVAVIRKPKLSEIEREALRLVPSGYSANNIAAAAVAPVTPALVVMAAAGAEAAARFIANEFVKVFVCFVHGCNTILTAIPDAVLEGEDFQNKLKSLPPEVTAAELLRLRADILLQTTPG
jgi:hypothetical protein